MRDTLAILVLLTALCLLSGCAARACHVQSVPMYWADGSESTMQVTVCAPRFR